MKGQLVQILNKDLRYVWLLLCTVGYFAMMKSPIKAKPFGDGDFHLEAKAISAWLLDVGPYEAVSISKAMGPVIFYVVPYTMAGADANDDQLLLFARIWTLICVLILQMLLYVRMLKYFGGIAANVFLLCSFIIPLHYYYALGIWAEGMAYLSILMILIGFIDSKVQKKWSLFFFIGLLFLAWSRPNSLLAFPFLFLISYWQPIESNLFFIKRFRIYLLFFGALSVSGLFLTKWLPNTRAAYYQADYMAYVQHIGRFQFRNESFDWRYWDASTRSGSTDFADYEASGDSLRQVAADRGVPMREVFSPWIMNDLIVHPFMAVKQFFLRVITGHFLQSNSINPHRIINSDNQKIFLYWLGHILVNLINLFFIAFFLVYIFKYGSEFDWLLIMPILALVLFHGFVYMEQRYMFPNRVIYLFFASLFVAQYFKNHKAHESNP